MSGRAGLYSGSMIPFSKHCTAPREAQYVQESLASGHLSGDGPFTRRAAAILGAHLNGAPVLLTPSCSDALELAALLCDLGPDDEVVMPSLTFSSTANAFAIRGAALRFADVDPTTFSMELPQLQAAVTPATRVVVAVHYGGVTRDIAAMRDYCLARGLRLVEDNAHGLFASCGGQPLGTFGPLGTLSFHGTKNVSCGEGGAVVVSDPALLGRAEILREKGTDRHRFLRGEVDRYTWREVGSSFLLADVLAALLTAQLEHAETIQARRHALVRRYRELLAPRAAELGLELQQAPQGYQPPAHLLAMLLPRGVERARVLVAMRERGVQATSHYEPLHLAPAYRPPVRRGALPSLPVTEDIGGRLLRLPLFPDLTLEAAERGAVALCEVLQQLGAGARGRAT
jgi:dTDP-4-amino-4,6-dideoxygalactose transaminase